MKRVEYEISDYYIRILRTFLSRADIGKRMIPPVTHAAVQRWETGVTFMSERDYRRLQDVMLNLAREFQLKNTPFFKDLSDILKEAVANGPDVTYRPPPQRKSMALTALSERLIELLHGKTRSSRAIIETLVEEGYSGGQIQRTATKIGVKKTIKGFGRSQRSYWSLK